MNLTRFAILPAVLALASAAAAQPSLTISLSAPHPETFNTGPQGQGAVLTNIVRTEPLTFTLATTPTPPPFPPAQLLPRRLGLYLGAFDATPTVFPQGSVFLELGGPPPLAALLDSFNVPWHPVFGPPLQGPTNTITFTVGADLFPPPYAFPLPELALQMIAEDTPGNPILVSNPVRFTLIDPDASGFAPTITDINPKFVTGTGNIRPLGPEGGFNNVVISGTNFLAQSNWIQFPPTVRFGTQASPFVIVSDNDTIICTVPPTAFPTNPPNTAACLVDVTLRNNTQLAPSAQFVLSPVQYLYLTGLTPATTGFDIPNGTPEGGQPRTLQGSNFLNGLILTFTSVANPALTTTIAAPPAVPGPGGTTVAYVTPPFCTGGVRVKVTNCDEVVSNEVVFDYVQLQPVLASGVPTFTVDAVLGGTTYIRVLDVGSALTINGANFLTAASPLATASTVPPGSFYPTKTFIDGIEDTGLVPVSAAQITGTTAANDRTGIFRPGLGYKSLRLENPPCVATGNAAPVSNVPCPPLQPPCTIVRQDASPPSLSNVFPAITSTNGCKGVRITGGNFFSVQNGVTFQDFTPFAPAPGAAVTNIPSTSLVVPAVLFGTRFAPNVTLVDGNTLLVDIPPAAAPGNSTVTVTVYNPDGQKSSAVFTFTYVPPLTDIAKLTDPGFPVLDAAVLTALTQGIAITGVPGAPASPAVMLVKNPSPDRDRGRDPAGVSGAAFANASYDYVYLFNTRLPGISPPSPGPRFFNFDLIDVPASVIVPPGGGSARILPIDPTIPAVPATETIGGGTELRVIFKALGYSVDGAGRVVFAEDENHAFFLQSHGDARIDALVHLGGDAFLLEDRLLPGSAGGGPFRVRVDRTLPPAGGGRGGRGGAFFPEGLSILPGVNFGVTPPILTGGTGALPPDRFDPPPPSPIVPTGGRGGVGTAPIGVQSGGGGGGGYVGPGVPGASGTAPGGMPGCPFGNVTSYGGSGLCLTSAAAPPGSPPAGAAENDALIYGATAFDFDRFRLETALGTGTIYGGSGGGGGGGGLAIFVPAEALGGRGGNGGGALVLLADCVLTLGPFSVLLAHGEQGQLGVDVFPVYNANPTIPVNVPGCGGGGTGGTILALAVAQICLPFTPVSTNPPCSVPAPPPAVPSPTAGRPIVSCRPGLGGPPPAAEVGPSVAFIVGGNGAPGRLRFAINSQSPYVGDLTSALTTLFTPFPAPPAGPGAIVDPAPAVIPAGYFTYTSL